MFFNTETKELSETIYIEDIIGTSNLILFNDDVNTFDWVIKCLVEFCNHTTEQAEQCALIVHFKGKCKVKSGTYKELEKICEALLSRGLSAKIEDN
ncbi:MAG: ATP-dependent Clp protease adaptor ClpS [Bacteroidetes bacterium]|nr:ATP-dependent Clp protease adaptor ClpS [Bacteroidota bacterium]